MLLSGLQTDLRGNKFCEYVERYRAPMQDKGLKRALISTLQHIPMEGMAEVYERVGGQGREVLLIWGREDRSIPFETSELVRKAITLAELHPIDGAGHVPYYQRPEVLDPILVEFLAR
jgi:pimeloyl-ACP methyl ester carboxylesterase